MPRLTIDLTDEEHAALTAKARGAELGREVLKLLKPHLGTPCPECGALRDVSTDATYSPDGETWFGTFQQNTRLLRCTTHTLVGEAHFWVEDNKGTVICEFLTRRGQSVQIIQLLGKQYMQPAGQLTKGT